MTGISRNSRYQRGLSLVEVMTATAIFAIIFVAALMIYDRSNKVYKQGVEAADMQQTTRIAFDKLVADVRMTGFDFDRDGTPTSALASLWRANSPYAIGNLIEPDPPNGFIYRCIQGGTSAGTQPAWQTGAGSLTAENAPSVVRWERTTEVQYQQPDEQVEFAGRSILGIRANFDYETDTGNCVTAGAECENGRETAYESDSFPIVTTGNDEIVLYALRPVAGGTFTSQRFFADMSKPRDVNIGTRQTEDTVTLPTYYDPCTGGCNNPPYTLYRISFRDTNGVNFVETPLAENIRSVEFRYYRDAAATDQIAVADLPNGEGAYNGADPVAIVAGRDLRTEIRAIRINIVGMNPQPDGDYTDPTETVAGARRHRKYQLETLVVPRNIGRHGMREFNTNTPGAPVLETVCAGSCNAVYLSWTAPTTGGTVETYNILYDTGPNKCVGGVAQALTFAEDAGRNLEGWAARWIIPGQDYHFAIQAVNRHGATTSNCMTIRVENTTQPEATTMIQATGGGVLATEANQITLHWTPVTENDDSNKMMPCAVGSDRETKTIPGAEQHYYRIYRSLNPAVVPGAPGTTLVLNEFSTDQPIAAGTELVWTDRTTANCLTYHYRIQTLDYCYQNAAWNRGNDMSLPFSPDYFPALSSDGIPGQAYDVTSPPAAPTGFAKTADSCDPLTNLCDVTFAWAPVTTDNPPGTPVTIDEYVLRAEMNPTGTAWIPAPLWPTNSVQNEDSVTGGALTNVAPNVMQGIQHRFFVRAKDCMNGDESTAVYYPCTFAGGSVTIAPSAVWGGTGIFADPWVTEAPVSINVSTQNPVRRIEAVFTQNGSPVGTPFSTTSSPISSAAIPVPDIIDGTPALVSITITDDTAANCALRYDYWIIDQPTPACALQDRNNDSTIVVWNPTVNDRVVNVRIENESTTVGDDFTILRVYVRWNPSTANNRASRLLSGVFPNGTLSPACALPNTEFDVQSLGSLVVPPASSRTFTLNFERARFNRPISTNPVASVCIRYRTINGDVLNCQISPVADICAMRGADCY